MSFTHSESLLEESTTAFSVTSASSFIRTKDGVLLRKYSWTKGREANLITSLMPRFSSHTLLTSFRTKA